MQKHNYVNAYNSAQSRNTKQKTLALLRKNNSSKFLFIGISLLLSGCMGIYEGGFECPPGKGVGCKSISEVNHMINAGELPPKAPAHPFPLEGENCVSCPSQPMIALPVNEPQIWFAPSTWEPKAHSGRVL